MDYEFQFGPLFDSRVASKLPEGAAYSQLNCSVERGLAEAMPGCTRLYQFANPTLSRGYGLGYGRWQDKEEFLAFVHRSGTDAGLVTAISFYPSTDLAAAAPSAHASRVVLPTANALHNSLWHAAQFEDSLYCANENDGLFRHVIGDRTSWTKVTPTFQDPGLLEGNALDAQTKRPDYPTRNWATGESIEVPTGGSVSVRWDRVAAPGDVDASGNALYTQPTNTGADVKHLGWFGIDYGAGVNHNAQRYIAFRVTIKYTPDATRPWEDPYFDPIGTANRPNAIAWISETASTIPTATAGEGDPGYSAWRANGWVPADAWIAVTEPGLNTGVARAIVVVDLDSAWEFAGSNVIDAVRRIMVGVRLSSGNGYDVEISPMIQGGVFLNKPQAGTRLRPDMSVYDGTSEEPQDVLYAYIGYTNATTESDAVFLRLRAEDAYGHALADGLPPMGATASITLEQVAGGYTNVRVWRKRISAGGGWHFLNQQANPATPTEYVDSLVDASGDIVAWPDPTSVSPTASVRTGGSAFGNSDVGLAPRCLGVWKTHMVLGVGNEVYMSYASRPDAYLASASRDTELFDTDDLTIGRTLYLSPDQSDRPIAIIPQDDLYLVGERGTYVMVGDSALSASPPRIVPDSRGALGPRAAVGFSGGVAVAAFDGLWWYRATRAPDNSQEWFVAEELTADIRETWRGFSSHPSHEHVVVAEFEGELWVFLGPLVLRRNKLGQWEPGFYPEDMFTGAAAGDGGGGGGDDDTPVDASGNPDPNYPGVGDPWPAPPYDPPGPPAPGEDLPDPANPSTGIVPDNSPSDWLLCPYYHQFYWGGKWMCIFYAEGVDYGGSPGGEFYAVWTPAPNGYHPEEFMAAVGVPGRGLRALSFGGGLFQIGYTDDGRRYRNHFGHAIPWFRTSGQAEMPDFSRVSDVLVSQSLTLYGSREARLGIIGYDGKHTANFRGWWEHLWNLPLPEAKLAPTPNRAAMRFQIMVAARSAAWSFDRFGMDLQVVKGGHGK